MALMTVGIDTSHNKKYSCTVSGFRNEIDKLYSEIIKVLAKHGRKGVIHWKVISSKVRKGARNEIYEIINGSKVHFTIFEHKKPFPADRADFYLRIVPNSIANLLERWLRNKYGTVLIKVDKDYEIQNVKKGSEKFVRMLLFQLGFRLTGTAIHIRKNHDFVANIGFPDGNMLQLIAGVSDRKTSNEIQLADLIMGYYLYDKEALENIQFIKI